MISVATQNALAATLVDDDPHMLHAWEAPSLGFFCTERRQQRVASPFDDPESERSARARPSADVVV